MGSQSRQHQAMDAQTRQAEALERIAVALERLANQYTPQFAPPNPDLKYDAQFVEDFEALIEQEMGNGERT